MAVTFVSPATSTNSSGDSTAVACWVIVCNTTPCTSQRFGTTEGNSAAWAGLPMTFVEAIAAIAR